MPLHGEEMRALRIPTAGRLVFLLALALPLQVAAQEMDEHQRWAGATWVDDLNFLSANAVLGGVTAGLISYLRQGSFLEGFSKGALGGGLAYVGKRVAAARFTGAGLLGRQVGAVGGSMTRNAAFDRGLLDTLTVPLGPLWAIVPPRSILDSTFRVDVAQVSWLVAGLLDDQLAFDWGRSVSAGAVVFRTQTGIRSDGELVDGVTVGGVILLSSWAGSHTDDVFRHERIHVIQDDYLRTTIGLPLEEWVGQRLGLDRLPLYDHLVTGLGQAPIHYILTRPWSRPSNLLEVEATFLEVR